MIALVILALPGLMTGCASEVSAPAAFQNAERIDFDDAAGRTALRLEPDSDSIRVEGPRGALIATVREKSGELVVENAAGEATWLIDESDDDRLRLRVRAASSDRVAFNLKEEPDGDLKIDDANGERIAVAKRRAYGFKVVSGAGETLARIRLRSGKISVRDAAGLTYLTTRDAISTRAAALLVIESLPVEVASGLGVATAFWTRGAAPGEGDAAAE
jgi:hypothetical protein